MLTLVGDFDLVALRLLEEGSPLCVSTRPARGVSRRPARHPFGERRDGVWCRIVLRTFSIWNFTSRSSKRRNRIPSFSGCCCRSLSISSQLGAGIPRCKPHSDSVMEWSLTAVIRVLQQPARSDRGPESLLSLSYLLPIYPGYGLYPVMESWLCSAKECEIRQELGPPASRASGNYATDIVPPEI